MCGRINRGYLRINILSGIENEVKYKDNMKVTCFRQSFIFSMGEIKKFEKLMSSILNIEFELPIGLANGAIQ